MVANEYPAKILSACPDCGSPDITPHGMEYAGPKTATEDVTCENCGVVCRQTYEVTATERVGQ